MSDRPDRSPAPDTADADRLNGWKEIASFVGKGVRTAQRWEKDYGLPVHRLGREGGEIIFASRREIAAWLEGGGGNSDGSVRAEIRPEHDVTFGGVTYSAPWLPYRVLVNHRPGGKPAIHLAFIHGQSYPALLLEIDAQGNTLAEYWSNGYVNQVEYIEWRGMEVLAVGASNNDTRGSSLALFESRIASGSAPAERGEYRCVTCLDSGAAEPSAFIVFPRRCLHQSINGTGSVGDVWADAAGSLFVRVEEGELMATGHFRSAVTYVLDSDLNLLRVEPLEGFFAEHDAWHKRGLIDHSLDQERDGPLFFPVRVWREDGFVDLLPAPIDWSQFFGRRP